MKAIQKFAIEKPVSTAMFFGLLVILGIIALIRIEINLLPKMEFPKLTIVTHLPNASPEDIENLVTRQIGDAIGNTSGLTNVSSESLEEKSIIKLQFSWGTKADFAAMEIREKLDSIRKYLPQDASRPIVLKYDPSDREIIEAVVFPKKMSNPKNLKEFLQKEFKQFIERIDGVASVRLGGGFKKEVEVELDKFKMNSSNVSLMEIDEAIKRTNVNTPAGNIDSGTKSIQIRTIGEFNSIDEIGDTLVYSEKDKKPIKLSAIASIREKFEEHKGLARYNGKDCVIISIYKESGKNPNKISENVRLEFRKILEKYPDDFEIQIIYDESDYVKNSIQNISQELIIGTVLAFLAIYIFLGSLHNSLILLTVVPTSVFATILFLYLDKISLNVMSLGGISLGIGMLFDSGNVVLSSIEAHRKRGASSKIAALLGANEVASSITSAVLTTIIVFLPIVFLKGIAGIIFGEMAVAVSVSLLMSLLCSLTLIPMLASIKKEKRLDSNLSNPRTSPFQNFENEAVEKYLSLLNYFFHRQKYFFLAVLFCFIVGMFFLFLLEKDFTPKTDRKEFIIKIFNSPSSNLKSTSEIAAFIEEKLMNDKRIQHILSKIGSEENSENSFITEKKPNTAEIKVFLNKNERTHTKDLINSYKELLKFRNGIYVEFKESGELVSNILDPNQGNYYIHLTGEDVGSLESFSSEIKNKLLEINGLENCHSSLEKSSEEIQITYDEDKLAMSNLDHEMVSRQLKGAIKGEVSSRIRLKGHDRNIRIRFKEEYRNSYKSIENIFIKNATGNQLYLTSFAAIKHSYTNQSIQKKSNLKTGTIQFSFPEKKKIIIVKEIESLINSITPPQGINLAFNQKNEDIEHSLNELKISFCLSVLFIYMLLASQFESFLFPFLMLGTIPLIFIGVSPALFLFGKSINISSFTGIILLVGIVVDNAALFYEYFEKFEKENSTIMDAVRSSSATVFKPILLNNITTILGLLPAILELGEGTDFQSPMAIAVAFGLFSSVIISLFLIPILFYRIRTLLHGK